MFNKFLASRQDISMKNIGLQDWDRNFLKALNLLPCPYHKYYYKKEDMLKEQLEEFNKGKTRALEVMETEKELFSIYQNPKLAEKPKELELRGGAYYSDVACNLISSIYNDKGDIQVVNTINKGTIKDFPDHYALEISSYISRQGPVPCQFIDEFPLKIKNLIHQIKAWEILAAEAAVEGDYNK